MLTEGTNKWGGINHNERTPKSPPPKPMSPRSTILKPLELHKEIVLCPRCKQKKHVDDPAWLHKGLTRHYCLNCSKHFYVEAIVRYKTHKEYPNNVT